MSEQMTETKTSAESTETASASRQETIVTKAPDTSALEVRVLPAQADKILVEAKELALKALDDIAPVDSIGSQHRVEANEEFLATHFFECLLPGYRGWFWFAILSRVPAETKVTVCEIGLLPGEDSLLAPAWVPWSERLRENDEEGFEDPTEDTAEEDFLDKDFEEDDSNDAESETDLIDSQDSDHQ